MTLNDPLARAPEPPENPDVVRIAAMLHPETCTLPEMAHTSVEFSKCHRIALNIVKAGYRIVPESPAEICGVKGSAWGACVLPPGHADRHDFRHRIRAVPESEVGLDAAWKEEEAALPEGWVFWQATGYHEGHGGEPARWYARARLNHSFEIGNEASGSGPTITAALLALAARLSDPSR